MADVAREKTMLNRKWGSAVARRCSIGQRRPSHSTAGVSAAQTYMPAIHPTST